MRARKQPPLAPDNGVRGGRRRRCSLSVVCWLFLGVLLLIWMSILYFGILREGDAGTAAPPPRKPVLLGDITPLGVGDKYDATMLSGSEVSTVAAGTVPVGEPSPIEHSPDQLHPSPPVAPSPSRIVRDVAGAPPPLPEKGTLVSEEPMEALMAQLADTHHFTPTVRPGWESRRRRSRVRCPVGDRTGLFPASTSIEEFFQRLSTDVRYSSYGPAVLSSDPWILQFDNFLSASECEAMIRDIDWWADDVTAGTGGSNLYRNSSSFSCGGREECSNRTGIQTYRKRVVDVLGIGLEHSEDLNVLRYEEGGYYKKHHDYIAPASNPDHDYCGPRVLSSLSYLTDVEDGGGTSFFHLGIVAHPKAGRMILWSNCMSDDPLAKDERTAHEALVVGRGTKIGATTWLNQWDREANELATCCHKWTSSGRAR